MGMSSYYKNILSIKIKNLMKSDFEKRNTKRFWKIHEIADSLNESASLVKIALIIVLNYDAWLEQVDDETFYYVGDELSTPEKEVELPPIIDLSSVSTRDLEKELLSRYPGASFTITKIVR